MNERLKELAEQAGLIPMWVVVNEPTGSQVIKPIDEQIIERFAELVRADEREAVIDIVARHGVSEIEAAIRQRGEK